MVPGSRGSGWLSERAATTISAPAPANARAMSLPIPRELPVTIATFPASVISHLLAKVIRPATTNGQRCEQTRSVYLRSSVPEILSDRRNALDLDQEIRI